ncbi:hypothetical protein Ahy_B07g087092 [Arachis hypogaea]|uniref:SWIM-type domain-containing protein n=1 Tax=Arachis hypogaea TaxID=3818 RepID=A0A444YBK2_ARAHY|nr:hypothetical protein Ahy_B07g087092 [Arachis hypogaea]
MLLLGFGHMWVELFNKEGVFCGIPFLTFPIVFDQPLDSKIIVEDWKLSTRVKEDVKMSALITFVMHHMGRLKSNQKDGLQYSGDTVSNIDRICMDTCNLFLAEGNYWEAQWVGDDEHNLFEVRRHGHRVTVNTPERTCTCRKWQLTGLSCCHGVAAIQRKNHRPEDYVHHWLCMEHYNRAYQFHINSVPSEEYWGDYEGYPCLPPSYKRPIGRPTKKRARHESERPGNSQYKMPRKYGQTTCKWCKKQGHNARTCKEKKKSLRRDTSQAAETASEAANEQEDAADISDREQEMYYEETLEAADEQQVTQGHPQSQTDMEQAQGLESDPAAASASTTTINKSAPPKVAGAVAAAPRLVRRGASSARAKIPIMRPPSTIALAHDPIRLP